MAYPNVIFPPTAQHSSISHWERTAGDKSLFYFSLMYFLLFSALISSIPVFKQKKKNRTKSKPKNLLMLVVGFFYFTILTRITVQISLYWLKCIPFLLLQVESSSCHELLKFIDSPQFPLGPCAFQPRQTALFYRTFPRAVCRVLAMTSLASVFLTRT